MHAEKTAWLDANFAPDDPLRDAHIECEPRYWMTWEEWCEFVESGEDFDQMARRERATGVTLRAALGRVARAGACGRVCEVCRRRVQ